MFIKQCLPAFACALTLSLATGGYAQSAGKTAVLRAASQKGSVKKSSVAPTAPNVVKATARRLDARKAPVATFAYPSRAAYPLLSPEAALQMPIRFPAATVTAAPLGGSPNSGPKSFVYGPSPIYDTTYSGGYVGIFPSFPDSNGVTQYTNSTLDDFDLPAGLTGTTGATVQNFEVAFYNDDQVNSHDFHVTVLVYNAVNLNASDTADPRSGLLATIPFDVVTSGTTPGIAANGLTGIRVTLATTDSKGNPITPLTLTHDRGTANEVPYGFQILVYDDAARTQLSQHVSPIYPYNSYGSVTGHSEDVAFCDFADKGSILGSDGFYFGGYPSPADLYLQIVGTSPNNPTYEFSGTLNFPSLMTSTANGGPTPTVTFTITSATQMNPTPIVITGPVGLYDVLTSRGTVMNEAADYNIYGLPLDTYNMTISSPGFAPATLSNITFVTTNTNVTPPIMVTGNAYNLNATLAATAGETVTGGVSLEGVADLSAVSPFAPLGVFEVQFRPVGSTMPTYDFTSVSLTTTTGSNVGTFSVAGIADGTYDVWIKGSKNLAVLKSSVAISATGAVVPTVTLPAGDADGDNVVGPSDFGIFVGAYNTAGGTAGNGYDPRADFNFDGLVDPTDFGLFVGDYNTTGPA